MTSSWKRMRIHPLAVLVGLSGCLAGCQGGLNGIPNLGNLNHPSRVPPPATGSFQIPPHYGGPPANQSAAPTLGQNASKPTTLGQLRAIESGEPVASKVGFTAIADAQVVNGVFPSRIDPPSSVVQASAIDDASKGDSVGSGVSTGPVVRATLKDDSDIKWVSP